MTIFRVLNVLQTSTQRLNCLTVLQLCLVLLKYFFNTSVQYYLCILQFNLQDFDDDRDADDAVYDMHGKELHGERCFDFYHELSVNNIKMYLLFFKFGRCF